MTVLLEELECVLEDWRAPLYTIVHPCGSVLFLIKAYRCCLPTADPHALDDGNFKLLWMGSESVCTGLPRISIRILVMCVAMDSPCQQRRHQQ